MLPQALNAMAPRTMAPTITSINCCDLDTFDILRA